MKKLFAFLPVVIVLVMIAGVFTSCKKGDGDPFFSLLSRKSRMAGDWKVSNLSILYSYKNVEEKTTFDGNKKVYLYRVKDSIWHVTQPTPHDSVADYLQEDIFTGYIYYTMEKSGTFSYIESFRDDSTNIAETNSVEGLWYFTGGNKTSGFKNKELLALQVTKWVFDTEQGTPYTTTYQGQNTLDIYEIYALKSKEVVLKVNTEETIGFSRYNTTLEMTLIPK